MIHVTLKHLNLAGSTEPLIAVARHVDPGGQQGIQNRLIGPDPDRQIGVLQLQIESVFLLGIE